MSNDNNSEAQVVKATKKHLPLLKKLCNPEHEDLCTLLNEAAMSSGLARAYYGLNGAPNCLWRKFHKGVWDVVLIRFNHPTGCKAARNAKAKMLRGMLPTFHAHCNSNEDNTALLPSFTVAVNLTNEYEIILKKRASDKEDEKSKKMKS